MATAGFDYDDYLEWCEALKNCYKRKEGNNDKGSFTQKRYKWVKETN